MAAFKAEYERCGGAIEMIDACRTIRDAVIGAQKALAAYAEPHGPDAKATISEVGKFPRQPGAIPGALRDGGIADLMVPDFRA